MRNTNYDCLLQNKWSGISRFPNSLSGESNVARFFSGASKFPNSMSGMDPSTVGLVTMTQTKPGST